MSCAWHKSNLQSLTKTKDMHKERSWISSVWWMTHFMQVSNLCKLIFILYKHGLTAWKLEKSISQRYRHTGSTDGYQGDRSYSFFMRSRRSSCTVDDGYSKGRWRTSRRIWICIITTCQLYANKSILCDASGSRKSNQTVRLDGARIWIKILLNTF